VPSPESLRSSAFGRSPDCERTSDSGRTLGLWTLDERGTPGRTRDPGRTLDPGLWTPDS
jgi:hypothetical protein